MYLQFFERKFKLYFQIQNTNTSDHRMTVILYDMILYKLFKNVNFVLETYK